MGLTVPGVDLLTYWKATVPGVDLLKVISARPGNASLGIGLATKRLTVPGVDLLTYWKATVPVGGARC